MGLGNDTSASFTLDDPRPTIGGTPVGPNISGPYDPTGGVGPGDYTDYDRPLGPAQRRQAMWNSRFGAYGGSRSPLVNLFVNEGIDPRRGLRAINLAKRGLLNPGEWASRDYGNGMTGKYLTNRDDQFTALEDYLRKQGVISQVMGYQKNFQDFKQARGDMQAGRRDLRLGNISQQQFGDIMDAFRQARSRVRR